METFGRAMLTWFLLSAIFSTTSSGGISKSPPPGSELEKYVKLASHCLSMFVQHGEKTGTPWFKELASKVLEKFKEDGEGYKFAFMDIFMRIKLQSPSDLSQGGAVNIQFPVRRFFPTSEIDALKLDVTVDGLANVLMSFSYEYDDSNYFPYKNTKTKSIKLTRKLVNGLWEHSITVDEDSEPIELTILNYEADMLNITFTDYKANIVKFDYGVQGLDNIETKLRINDEIYSLNININLGEETARVKVKMPNKYFDVVYVILRWSNNPLGGGISQYGVNLQIAATRDDKRIFNMNNVLKIVPFGPVMTIDISIDFGVINLGEAFGRRHDYEDKSTLVGTTDLLNKYSEVNVVFGGSNFEMKLKLNDELQDQWKVEGTGNIFQPIKVDAMLKKDFSTSSILVMYADERVASLKAKEITMMDNMLLKALLDFSLSISGFSAKGNMRYEKGEKGYLGFSGVFVNKKNPMDVKFAVTFDDYGGYNFVMKYSDDKTTFEFFQTQETTEWDIIWNQRQILNGAEKTLMEWRLVDNSFFLNIYEKSLGKLYLKMGRHHNKIEISLKVEPNGFKDAEVLISLDMKGPDDELIEEFPEGFENEVDFFEEAMGKFAFGASFRILRGGKLVFGDFLDVNINDAIETVSVTVDTITEYSMDFFAHEYVCKLYGLLEKCFTKDISRLSISMDKLTKVFGVINPIEVTEAWERDGVIRMASTLVINEDPIVFNLYLPEHLPTLMNDNTLTIKADMKLENGFVSMKTNFQDMELRAVLGSDNYQANFTRYGKEHLSVVTYLNMLWINGTVRANINQETDSLITQALCSGTGCYETAVIEAEYSFDLTNYKFIANTLISSEAMDEDKANNDPVTGDDSVDPFVKELMRMQEGLEILQGITLPEVYSTKPANFVSSFPNGVGEYGPDRRGANMSFELDLVSNTSEWKINDIDGERLKANLVWNETYVSVNASENLIWNTNSTLTVDWLTPAIKMGFLIEHARSLETYEKLLESAQYDDLTILLDPTASVSTIGKQSLYGIGLVGLGESHVVIGQMNQWDKNEMEVVMSMEEVGHPMEEEEEKEKEEEEE